MFVQYIGLLFSFAFRRSTVRTDVMQILAASALPGVAKFAGFKMPDTASNDVLAYIGLATIAFIVLRLIYAPYAVWKEQLSEMGVLREELAKPERVEANRLAEIRAEAKADLAYVIAQMGFLAMRRNLKRDQVEMSDLIARGMSGSARANVCRAFDDGFRDLGHYALDFAASPRGTGDEIIGHVIASVNLMQSYLHGEIKAEALALQLQPYIGPGKRQ